MAMNGARRWLKAPLLMLTLSVAACSEQPESVLKNANAPSVMATTAPVPALAMTGRVTDQADVLDAAQETALITRLEAFERMTGHQFVVVIVASLAGRDVAAFTTDLANAWGIGQRGQDDGIVLLIAPNEHQARIAVGRGMKTRLPDAVCAEIMEQAIIPPIKAGDLPGGIDAGVAAIIAEIGPERSA